MKKTRLTIRKINKALEENNYSREFQEYLFEQRIEKFKLQMKGLILQKQPMNVKMARLDENIRLLMRFIPNNYVVKMKNKGI